MEGKTVPKVAVSIGRHRDASNRCPMKTDADGRWCCGDNFVLCAVGRKHWDKEKCRAMNLRAVQTKQLQE